jgi:hypothetical protein
MIEDRWWLRIATGNAVSQEDWSLIGGDEMCVDVAHMDMDLWLSSDVGRNGIDCRIHARVHMYLPS